MKSFKDTTSNKNNMNTLPIEIVNKIIMTQIPSYEYLPQLKEWIKDTDKRCNKLSHNVCCDCVICELYISWCEDDEPLSSELLDIEYYGGCDSHREKKCDGNCSKGYYFYKQSFFPNDKRLHTKRLHSAEYNEIKDRTIKYYLD